MVIESGRIRIVADQTASESTCPDSAVHIHGNGRHLLPTASTIRGLKAILLADDVGFPRAFDVIDELKPRAGGVPVSVFAPFERFVERLEGHTLPGGVLYQVTDVPDIDTAKELTTKITPWLAENFSVPIDREQPPI